MGFTMSTRTPLATAFCSTARLPEPRPLAVVGSVYWICTVRPVDAAQSCRSLIAWFRRSMPSGFVRERPSMSMSSLVTPYVVTS